MRSLRGVGVLLSLLIVGVLGGVIAPPPSEARTVEIDTITNVSLFNYTCETGYNSCAYLIDPTTGTAPRSRTIGGWVVSDVSATNRARVRIQDIGGAGGTANIDKMNITGVKFTPVDTTGSVTTHIKITHTYSTGQNKGDYHFGVGVTGVFDPTGQTNVLGDHFILTASGTFNDGNAANPSVALGTLNLGAFSVSPGPGINGPITQTIATRSVKNPCDTNGSGYCRPTVKYDLQITSVDGDSLVLTDSGLWCGITIPEGHDCDSNPAGPICRQLKKCGAILTSDAKNVTNATTCVNTNTCGTIEIKKTTAAEYDFGGACGQGGLCPHTLIVQDSQTFGFDGTGSGIFPFVITTDGVTTGSKGSYSLDFLDTTSGTRVIRETVFPETAFPGVCNPSNPCFNSVHWFTKTVSCTPASGGPEGFVYYTFNGLKNMILNQDGTQQRSGGVVVSSLAVNPSGGPVVQLTCTFENGIFEDR